MPFCGRMVKAVSSNNTEQPDGPTDAPSDIAQLPPAVAGAVESLATAAHTRRIDFICKAYEELKTSANGFGIQHLLTLTDKVIGKSALALIVAAYAHEKCFMCTNGSSVCEVCSEDEAGSASQIKCSNCNSTGLTPCEFCAGTGWVGDDVIPHELHRSVWRSRLKQTHHILEKYAKTYPKALLDDISQRPSSDDQRRLAIVETIRLSAKLHALTQSSAVTDPKHFKHLATAETKVSNCLKILSGN
jgi:hypothetical protein